MRGETRRRVIAGVHIVRFQSTPLMRGETNADFARVVMQNISIHSPHARGDRGRDSYLIIVWHFNPLPSCEGRRFETSYHDPCFQFQSTPLMRGETKLQQLKRDLLSISIHSPHARGDAINSNAFVSSDISIHSPHARGDEVKS